MCLKRGFVSAVALLIWSLQSGLVRAERLTIERIVVTCEDLEEVDSTKEAPDYGDLLQVSDADQADEWSWDWSEDGLELETNKPS